MYAVDSVMDLIMSQWTSSQSQSGASSPSDPSATKQHEWDKPFIAADKARLMLISPERYHQALLLAVSAPHSGDWLHVLPISSCGLHLDDEAVRFAVGLLL